MGNFVQMLITDVGKIIISKCKIDRNTRCVAKLIEEFTNGRQKGEIVVSRLLYTYISLWNWKWHGLSWVIYEHSTRFGATNALLYDFTAGGTSYWWQLAFSFALYTIAEYPWTLSRPISDVVASLRSHDRHIGLNCRLINNSIFISVFLFYCRMFLNFAFIICQLCFQKIFLLIIIFVIAKQYLYRIMHTWVLSRIIPKYFCSCTGGGIAIKRRTHRRVVRYFEAHFLRD